MGFRAFTSCFDDVVPGLGQNFSIMTLEERKNKAKELHDSGYNCAQSVLLVFEDVTGLDKSTAARVAAGMGAGMGATGEICGVVSAMAIVQGMTGGDAPRDKVAAARETNKLAKEFEQNNGYLRCKDLKGKGKIPCSDLISNGVEILYRKFFGNQD